MNMMNDILLEVKNFGVTLDQTPILKDMNFNVSEGEFLTIMGPNGSGKTVLVKALLGLIPYEGELKWYKKPKIGYLPQGLNQMSVRDMPLTVKDFFTFKKLKQEEILKYLNLVGLASKVLNRRAGFLSGGEFQRMLVAWVLASKPNIVFLDEPTTAIDIPGGETIYTLLREIWENQKLTIINVTHDLNIVFGHSTHVLCLTRLGHRCYGVPKEVLTPDVLRDIYKTDIKFYTHDKEGRNDVTPTDYEPYKWYFYSRFSRLPGNTHAFKENGYRCRSVGASCPPRCCISLDIWF